MKLQRFDGGLSTRLAAQLIRVDQSRIYNNIDNTSGVLSPVKDKTLIPGETGYPYIKWFDRDNEWVGFNVDTNFVESQGFLFSSNGVDIPLKRRGGVTNLLGIAKPTVAPILTNLSGVASLTGVEVQENITVGVLDTVQTYYLIFNIKDGIKSKPHFVTVTPIAAGGIDTKGEESTVKIPPFRVEKSLPKMFNRSLDFTNFKGVIGDSIEVYKYVLNAWERTGIATLEDDVVSHDGDAVPVGGRVILDESTVSNFDGTYQYVYTYYNSVDGTESAPSPLSEELKVSSGAISIDMVSTQEAQVDKIRIYRIGGNITTFTLVEEVAKTVEVYTDTIPDSLLDGRTLQSENFEQAPMGLKYITQSYAMLFGALGSTLRFTPVGKPNAWPSEYFLQYDDDITGMGPVTNGFIVMTKHNTHLVTGSGPFSLASTQLRGDQGCVSHNSVQQVKQGMLIWASQDGLCMSSGSSVTSITKPELGKRVFDVVNSVVVDEVYYLQLANGITFAWDYRFTPIFKELTLGISSVTEKDGELYGTDSNLLYSLMTSSDNLSMSYSSPKFIEGLYTEIKSYIKFYFRSKGDIIIKILIDEKLVITKSLSTTDTHTIKIPQDKQRGYSCSVEITGTGTVDEIEYEVSRRKNG